MCCEYSRRWGAPLTPKGDEYFCVAPDYTCAIPPDPSKALEGEDCENDPDCESGAYEAKFGSGEADVKESAMMRLSIMATRKSASLES